jgi:hypothetical protein
MHADPSDGASLEQLLRDEVEERPFVAYRLLELLAASGWRIRIERGSPTRILAEKGPLGLEASDERLGPASVSLFVRATSAAGAGSPGGRQAGRRASPARR